MDIMNYGLREKYEQLKKFGENCVSRSPEGLEAEGYQRFWIYDYINQGTKRVVREMGWGLKRKKRVKNMGRHGDREICSTEQKRTHDLNMRRPFSSRSLLMKIVHHQTKLFLIELIMV